MNDAMLRSLMERIEKLERERVRYRQGVVTDDDPLSVAIGGAATPYTGADSLAGPGSLRRDDNVGALTWGNSMLVLGALTGTQGVRARAYSACSTVTTTSFTPSTLDTLTTGSREWSGRPVLVLWSVQVSHSVSGSVIVTTCTLDGTAQGNSWGHNASGSNQAVMTAFALLTPSPGSHTVDIRWYTSAATATVNNRSMLVVEF